MVYGRSFLLITDHKPLLAIFGSKKGILVCTANRFQRWATTLLGYEFTIRYIPTTSIEQADALFRLISFQPDETEESVVAAAVLKAEIHSMVVMVTNSLSVTEEMIANATERDSTIKEVMGYLQNGWPTSIKGTELQQYYQRREALSVAQKCLMFAHQVVIPRQLRPQVLQQFHVGHPGISRMKAISRSYVYWPSLDSQIVDVVRSCSACINTLKKQMAFKIGDLVFAKDYRPTRPPWTSAVIQRQLGHLMYEIVVGDMIWRRHINQLRKRPTPHLNSPTDQSRLDWEILVDQPNPPQAEPSTRNKQQRPNNASRRISQRKRKTVFPMELHPHSETYY